MNESAVPYNFSQAYFLADFPGLNFNQLQGLVLKHVIWRYSYPGREMKA